MLKAVSDLLTEWLGPASVWAAHVTASTLTLSSQEPWRVPGQSTPAVPTTLAAFGFKFPQPKKYSKSQLGCSKRTGPEESRRGGPGAHHLWRLCPSCFALLKMTGTWHSSPFLDCSLQKSVTFLKGQPHECDPGLELEAS